MALESIFTGPADVVIKNLTNIIAAFGGILFLYLVFSVINLIMSRRRLSKIQEIDEKVDEILGLLKKRKK